MIAPYWTASITAAVSNGLVWVETVEQMGLDARGTLTI
jgi:hypothetical protein